ncbi:hypothetical protein ABT288_26185 [Streptomyces sp. NPDC001093]|uniref:hypothetical protein n=1 Tax=Streptomyces sp. NPDC001093 TaxID=3154376 RepID=UPI0033341015
MLSHARHGSAGPDPEAVLARLVDKLPATDEECCGSGWAVCPRSDDVAASVMPGSGQGHKFAGKTVTAVHAAS